MAQFLLNCEVETRLHLAPGSTLLRYAHPRGVYQIFVRDLPFDPKGASPLLLVQVVFDAPSIEQAKDVGEGHILDFLNHLAFVANATFHLRQTVLIVEWRPDAGMHPARYFAAVPDAPILALHQDLLTTVAYMQQSDAEPRLRRALKWFRNGVAAEYTDDQFSFFWLVIEVLAEVIKEPARIPDRCPVCRGPLFCEACAATPTHRPYPKQSIEALFQKYAGPSWEALYERAGAARNALFHGGEGAEIEAAIGGSLGDLVDQLGRLAWIAILNQFIPALAGKQVAHLATSRYVHMNMSIVAHMDVGYRYNADDPDPNLFPKATLVSEPVPPERHAPGKAASPPASNAASGKG